MTVTLELVYEWCLVRELELRRIACVNQRMVRIEYKGFECEELLRFDLLVEGCVLVEVKAVQDVHPIHKAQLLSYMKLLDVPLGLILNFHVTRLVDGAHASCWSTRTGECGDAVQVSTSSSGGSF